MSRIAEKLRPNNKIIMQNIMIRQLKLIRAEPHHFYFAIYSVIILVTLFYLTIGHSIIEQDIAEGILLGIWTVSLVPELIRALDKDYELGFIQQFYLTGCSLELALIAKLLPNYLLYCLLLLIILPINCLLLALPFSFYLWYVFIVLTLILSLIMMLGNCLIIGTHNIMISNIFLTIFAIPSLVIAKFSFQEMDLLLIMLCILAFLFPFCIIFSSMALKAALED